ncbi:hypothetical protein ACKWTF_002638 [Chironomus riparius]
MKKSHESSLEKMQRIDFEQIDSSANSSESEPLIVEKSTSLKRRLPKYNSNNNFRIKHHRILIFSSIFVLLLFIHLIIFSNVKMNIKKEVAGWSKNTSRDIADYILPNLNTTLIDSNVCHINEDPLLLLIVVCSSADNFDARQTIRETWGNTSQFNYKLFDKFHGSHDASYLSINYQDWKTYSEQLIDNSSASSQTLVKFANFRISVVFLLGISPTEMSDEQQSVINYEHEKYGDIIQENFLDSYNNLTLKSILMLKWVRNNCIDKVKYIMKCDDDTFINVPNLIHILLGGTLPIYKSTISFYDKESIFVTKKKNRLPESKHLLLGYKFCNAKKILDPRSKWYAPNYMFSGPKYPDYLSGTAYVFTIETARSLYNESLSIPLFHLEDVYLTGFVAEKLKLKRTHHPLFFYQFSKDKCSARGMISQHQLPPPEMQELYNFVTNLTINCHTPEKNFLSMKLKLTQRKGCH